MQIVERAPNDAARLKSLVARERDAKRRDRLRAVLLALHGKEAPVIAEMLGRSRRAVQEWVYAYRDGGIDAIHPPPRPGRRTKLPREREDELRARIDAGPRPEDGVCTLRGKDVVRILEREFGVRYSLMGAYDLLHRLGYSALRPRPRHEKRDLAKQAEFRERAPLLSSS
ncbi:MAG: winged helix-turn-helix domain-containing protein [Phycisphaerales bacterium]